MSESSGLVLQVSVSHPHCAPLQCLTLAVDPVCVSLLRTNQSVRDCFTSFPRYRHPHVYVRRLPPPRSLMA
ncbi:hypothetical protein BR93DRAFT_926006 [Coniochaeta sp. PMI_546]|nr:hypothetical protein BR93DRAFT_926006 [Coniochaeta sp. PMI_546]